MFLPSYRLHSTLTVDMNSGDDSKSSFLGGDSPVWSAPFACRVETTRRLILRGEGKTWTPAYKVYLRSDCPLVEGQTVMLDGRERTVIELDTDVDRFGRVIMLTAVCL